MEGGQDHRGAADFAGGEKLGIAPRHVKEGNRDQRTDISLRGDEVHPMAGLHVSEKVLMRRHGSFGEACGARSVEDRRYVGGHGVFDGERRAIG